MELRTGSRDCSATEGLGASDEPKSRRQISRLANIALEPSRHRLVRSSLRGARLSASVSRIIEVDGSSRARPWKIKATLPEGCALRRRKT